MIPIWQDPDDSNFEVDIQSNPRLRKLTNKSTVKGSEYAELLRKFHVSTQRQEWYEQNVTEDSSSIQKLISSSKDILSAKSRAIPPQTIETEQMENINMERKSEGCLTSIDFYGEMVLCGGLDKKVSIFTENVHRMTCYMKDMPVHSAKFQDNVIIIQGQRPFFYTFDVESQTLKKNPIHFNAKKRKILTFDVNRARGMLAFGLDDGEILLYSSNNMRHIFSLKMTQPASSVVFLGEDHIVAGGNEGEVYTWNLGQRTCEDRFWDENAINITAMAASDRYLAVGSNTGVVNLYKDRTLVKSVDNLTTSVTDLCFNHTQEMLVACSKWKRDAVKLVNLNAMSVYSNWPSFKDHLKYPFAVKFSPDSSLIGIGNDEGNALLYKVNHFSK